MALILMIWYMGEILVKYKQERLGTYIADIWLKYGPNVAVRYNCQIQPNSSLAGLR